MTESLLRHFMFGEEPPPQKPRRARIEKQPGAFLTIGELAEQLKVEQHVLRYWESKFPQIQPLKRAGGRRYYRTEDVEIISRIQTMLYRDGYTIRGAQKALAGGAEMPEEKPIGVEAATPLPVPGIEISKVKVQELLAELRDMRRLLQS